MSHSLKTRGIERKVWHDTSSEGDKAISKVLSKINHIFSAIN